MSEPVSSPIPSSTHAGGAVPSPTKSAFFPAVKQVAQRYWPVVFRGLASLKLTVWLLGLSILVVFVGTLDQVDQGILHTQKIYFQSFIARTPVPALVKLFFTQQYDPDLARMVVPLPGGTLLGLLLIVNLGCAHFRHFKARWSHLGVSLLHGGLVLLLASGFLIGFLQKEGQMWITEGGRSNYSSDIHRNELVLVDVSDPTLDRVTAIEESALASGKDFRLPDSEVTLRVHEFFPNAVLLPLAQNPTVAPTRADRGAALGMGLTVMPQPKTYADGEVNTATAVVEVLHRGRSLGTWLVANVLAEDRFPPQEVTIDGRPHHLALRFRRTYHPFYLALDDFTHDRWPGTQIPRHFASDVRVQDPTLPAEIPVHISMNHPLRHGGLTFYQASFGPEENSTMLQVVRNPAAALPYWAVLIIGIGMTVQFTTSFTRFLAKRRR